MFRLVNYYLLSIIAGALFVIVPPHAQADCGEFCERRAADNAKVLADNDEITSAAFERGRAAGRAGVPGGHIPPEYFDFLRAERAWTRGYDAELIIMSHRATRCAR